MRLVADQTKCITAGLCVLAAPDVFSQDDKTGTVVLTLSRPPSALEQAVREAVNLCPSGAIRLVAHDE
jgi:ferredoxin